MSSPNPTRRRIVLAGMAGLGAGVAPAIWSTAALAADAPETLRIGYQKSSTLMIWLKSRQVLEQALA
ncbi:aliphatic sulfonate ABC transporter substrate-binding protein, partial [Cupriavidus sp. CER94]